MKIANIHGFPVRTIRLHRLMAAVFVSVLPAFATPASAQDAAPIRSIKVLPPHTDSLVPRPSQDTIDALSGQLKAQIAPCWKPPKGASESGVKVTLDVHLNKDGTLGDQTIVVVSGISHPLALNIIVSAKEAVKECAERHPFKLPAESYPIWAKSRITFDPSRP